MKTQLFTDMPAEEYFSIRALSASGIKSLHAGPLDYYYYHFGSGAEQEATAAMKLGTAKHLAGLEGLEAFKRVYVPAIDKRDYENVLDSQEELKAWCREHGLAVGGSKAVLCERITESLDAFSDDRPTLWMDEVNHQKDMAHENGQEILSQDDYKDALSKAKQISPIINQLRDAGGLPEVVILFEYDGIPCKVRIDFLAPGIVLDLKNVQNSTKMPFSDLISKTMANMLMLIQAEFYLRAVRAASIAGLLPFQYDGEFSFRWLFLQSTGTPNMAIRRYVEKYKSLDTGLIETSQAKLKAMRIIEEAKETFRKYMASHGTGQPWVPPLDDRDMADEDYPFWFLADVDDDEVEL